MGILAALLLIVGIFLIYFFPRRQWLIVTLLLALITPVALSGFWFSLERWGISDWDFYFSLHHTWRDTILTHHQFPFWNPATCGGTAGLGEPEFSVLTPTFLLFELPFGIEAGLRLAIFFATLLGALGMVKLSHTLKLSPLAGLAAGLIYAFSSVNLLEIVEGHVNIFSAMYLPWIFWSWLLAYRSSHPLKNSLLCGFFLALTFYQGGIYLLMYTSLAFLTLPLFTHQPLTAYKTSILAGLWALGLAGFKLIPTLYWLRQFQDDAYASSINTLPWLYDIFFVRHLHGTQILPEAASGWHEYGAYLGWPAALLALYGLLGQNKRRLRLALLATAALALLLSTTGPLLKPFFDVAPFLPRSNISRLVIFTIIPLALLAGFGLNQFKNKFLQHLLLGLLALDLLTLASALSYQAFVVPPVVPHLPPTALLAFDPLTYDTRINGVDQSRSYAANLAGYGTLNYCTSLGPTPAVRTIYDEGNSNLVTIQNGTIQHFTWSPNQVNVQGFAEDTTTLTLNTNFAKGWWVNDQPAQERNNLVSTSPPPGNFSLTFLYHPPGLLFGSLFTLLTIILGGVLLIYHRP
jgi:hypothetical protein